MTVSVTKCDICGKAKGEANKWLQALVYNAPNDPGIYIGRLFGLTGAGIQLDICSDACLQKKLGEVLAAIRTEPEQAEARPPEGGIASDT